jgi:hypothetical protein
MKHFTRSWALALLLLSFPILSPVITAAQNLELPADYAIDFRLAEAGRARIMNGSSDITGTVANGVGEEVFHRLISATTPHRVAIDSSQQQPSKRRVNRRREAIRVRGLAISYRPEPRALGCGPFSRDPAYRAAPPSKDYVAGDV